MVKSSTPNSSRRRAYTRCRHHFPVGSRVEIQTNDDDLYDVFFSATVVPPPSSGRKNSSKLYVEYDNLVVSEDAPDPLIEHVKISVVRPEPPLVAHGFATDDVVDAFYRDGWWAGVVSRVVEGGKRFAVAFEKPPEVHDFGLSELRAHWDWVDGVWALPHKPPIVTGMKVEVSLSDFEGVWIPAEIVQCLENGAVLVECSGNDGVLVKREVNCLHVRPSPPIVKVAKFRESEKVEAFFNFGWWSGVITNELEKNGYTVLFEVTKLKKNVFDRSELRPLMDWKDGKWFRSPTVSAPVNAMDINTPLPSRSNSFRTCTAKKRKSIIANSEGSMKKNKKRKDEDANQENEVEKMLNAAGIEEIGANKENEVTTTEKILVVAENAAGEVGQIEEMGAMKKNNGEIDQENEVTKMSEVENAVGIEETGDNQENEVCTTEKILEVAKNAAGEVGQIEEMGAMKKKKKHNGEIDQEKVTTIENSKMLNDELPCAVGIELTNLPFVKGHALWKTFESMEIFRKLPQRPHFEPLRQSKESLREGLAVNCFVNFTNAVDRCCSLKIDDPKSEFYDLKEILSDLEGHGFDVAVMQRHIINLLEMKGREEKLAQEMKELNNNISEHGEKRSKIKKQIEVINGQLRRLLEQISIEETCEANEVDEIARLEAELKEVEQHIKSVRSDFEGVVARLQMPEPEL